MFDPYLGGAGMTENILFGRVQGAALAPGSTVTVTRQQLNTKMIFFPKAYVAWTPIDDWELDDGSGTGGVINSGEAAILNQYQVIMENMTMTINTMLEMDSFRHGQASSGSAISDNRILNTNGLDEALNNGIDCSPYGNVYTTYGSDTRNGVIGPALNSTPLYLGTKAGAVGQIDFNALIQLWAQCVVRGGKPDLGITNVFGFACVANALDAQRRDISNTKHDIKWDGLNFNGVDIYPDPLAPSSTASNYLSLAPSGGKAGNNNLADGAGSSTQLAAITSPTYTSGGVALAVGALSPTGSRIPSGTTLQPGEWLAFLESESFKIRPTNKKGWNYGLRRAPFPDNVSLDALFMRLGTNLYNVMPAHNAVAFGFGNPT